MLSTEDFSELQRWPVQGGAFEVDFSPDGQRVAVSANGRYRLEVRSAVDGALQAALDLTSACWKGFWNPADGSVVFEPVGEPLRVWRPQTGEVEIKRALGMNGLFHWCFARASELALTHGWQHLTMLWDLPNERMHVSIPGMGLWVSADDRRVGFLEQSFSLEFQALGIWELASDRECRRLRILQPRGPLRAAQTSPDGRLVCLPDTAGVTLWDTRTGAKLAVLPVESYWAMFTATGDNLITGDVHGWHFWPLRDEGGVVHLGPPEPTARWDDLRVGVINADRTHLACADEEGRISLVNLSDRAVVPSVTLPARPSTVAISPDVCTLAETKKHVGSTPESGVRIWNLKTGELVRKLLSGHFSVEFSENGRFLLTHNQDEYYVWECATWDLVRHVSRSELAGTTVPDTARAPDAVPVGPDRLIFLDPETADIVLSLDIRLPEQTVHFLPRAPLVPITLDHEPYVLLYDMRLVRERLRELGLDWDAPPYAPPPDVYELNQPLRVEVHLGDLAAASHR